MVNDYEDIFRKLSNNCEVVKKILISIKDSELRKELKEVFIYNIDPDVFQLARRIYSIMTADFKKSYSDETDYTKHIHYWLYAYVKKVDEFVYGVED